MRFASVDIASETHVVALVDEDGTVLLKPTAFTEDAACNDRLRRAITCFADNSHYACPWAGNRYAAARARGSDYPYAVRIFAPAWIRVLSRLWIDRSTHDPARHRAALAFNTAKG